MIVALQECVPKPFISPKEKPESQIFAHSIQFRNVGHEAFPLCSSGATGSAASLERWHVASIPGPPKKKCWLLIFYLIFKHCTIQIKPPCKPEPSHQFYALWWVERLWTWSPLSQRSGLALVVLQQLCAKTSSLDPQICHAQ